MKRIGRIGHTMRVVLFALLVVVLSASSAAAWYFTASTLNMGQVGGSVDYLAKYFESGDGTSATQFAGSSLETDRGCAFEIANEDQFYNLAWLQYLGYFNETEENSTNVPTVYFYLSADLDMTGYTLPPIGTVDNPFLGNFNGNGHTVSNLTVANVTEKVSNTGNYLGNEELPLEVRVKQEAEVSGVEIIGLFGVVGSLPNDSGYTYSSATNQVKNVNVTGLTVETQTATALIGLAAGYVNGTLFNVGIANSTITVKDGTTPVDTANLTDNMSDYALVGYCTDAYKTMVKQDETVTKRYLLATVPQLVNQAMDAMQSGEDNAWGGSIAMSDMYDRLLEIRNASTRVSYVSSQAFNVDINGNETATGTPTTANGNLKNYAWDGIGQYSFSMYDDNDSGDRFMYLYGHKTFTPDKAVTRTYQYEGVKLFNNGRYLIGSANGVSAGTNANNATLWVIDETAQTVYCWVNNTKYYLRYNGNTGDLSTSNTTSTIWIMGDDDCLYYNNTNYALHCIDDEWIVTNTASGSDLSYFYLNVGGNGYLLGATNNNAVTLVTDKAAATKWEMNNDYIVRLGTTNAYLRYNNNNNPVYVSTGTDSRYTFTTNNNISYLYTTVTSGNWWNQTTTYYYVRYNNGLTVSSSTNQTTARNNATAVTREYDTIVYDKTLTLTAGTGSYTLTTTEDGEYESLATFFPLSLNADGTIRESNTGYIVSGADYINPNYPNTYYKSGDIRVSQYYARDLWAAEGYTSASDASNYDNRYAYEADRLEIITRTSTSNGYVRISDDYNASNRNINTTISNRFPTKTAPSNIGLKNYSSVRSTMDKVFLDSVTQNGRYQYSKIFGLHFMDATIGNDYVTVPTAVINGDTFVNYQLPTNCIDFHLKDAGRITFMAGTYFSGNTAFFSLHEITRNEDTKEITSIKEISKIYGNEGAVGQDYVYVYRDGTSSGSTGGLNLLFDLDWITSPGNYMVENAVYYFEIPVNSGEYALGSVSGEDGAYLFYLDIGANGRITSKYAWIATTEDDVLVEDRVNRYGVPAGVDFAPVGTVGDADATVALTGSGSASFSRSGDTITGTSGNALSQTLTFLRDDAEADAAYVKNGATLTEAEVKPDTYSETDYLDAPTNAQPAFDTYGVDHQLITKTLTVRLHDLDAIEDVFTIRYSYEKDGILDDADDPVTVNYTDPLVYMIQYDASKVTTAPALVSNPDAGFKGTIYIGATGDDSTLTQLYPAGTKTVVPGEKVYFQVYSHDELFRIYGDTASAANVSYDSVLNNTTDEQDFTYTVTGSALETPITGDGVTTASSSSTAATLEYTLAAPADDESGNRTLNALNALNAGKNLLSVSPLTLGNVGKTGLAPIGLAPQIPDETDPADDPDGVDAEPFDETLEEGGSTDGTYVEPFFGWTTPVQTVTNGSRSEYSDDEHVTRYYEYFPDDPAADEDGWILVLEIYDEGYEPEQTDETGGETPADGDTPEGGETPAEGEGTEGGETPADGEGTEGGEEPADGEGTGAGEPTDGGTDGNETDEEPGDGETPVSGGETGGDETIADGDETDPAQEPDEGSGEEAQGEGEGIEQVPETGDDEETPAAEPGGGIVNDGDDATSGETPATGEVTEATDGDPGGPPQEPPEEPPEESPEGNSAEL